MEVRLEKFESKVDRKFGEIDRRFDAVDRRFEIIEKSINNLAASLDKFLRQLIDQNDKVKILALKVDRMASFLKEKFGVEIAA